MNINKLINKNGQYWPFHTKGFFNHLPMVQYALYHLGASEDQIISFERHYLTRYQLEIIPFKDEIEHLDDHLGNRQAYEGYVRYFKARIEEQGVDQVLKATLNQLVLGLSSALFHGLIRIGYAVLMKDVDEISRALASWACCYQAIEFGGEKINSEEMHTELHRYILDREGLFYLDQEGEEKEVVMMNAYLELYLTTGSFIVLHTLTGFEALLSVKDYFDDFSHVLDVYHVSVLRALLRVTENDYKKIVLESNKTWDEIYQQVLDIKEAHTVKFVYTCHKLNKLHPNDQLRIASQIKLKLDHNL